MRPRRSALSLMRVVIASTAATIANILCDAVDGYIQSRGGRHSEMCWAVCEYFWRSATDVNLCTEDASNIISSVQALLSEGRPLVWRIMSQDQSYKNSTKFGYSSLNSCLLRRSTTLIDIQSRKDFSQKI